jgi:hypothetical protein
MKSGICVTVGCESKPSCDQYLTHITVFLYRDNGTDVTVLLLLPPRRRRLGRGDSIVASSAIAAARSRDGLPKRRSLPPSPPARDRNWRRRRAWPGHMRRRHRARAGPAWPRLGGPAPRSARHFEPLSRSGKAHCHGRPTSSPLSPPPGGGQPTARAVTDFDGPGAGARGPSASACQRPHRRRRRRGALSPRHRARVMAAGGHGAMGA